MCLPCHAHASSRRLCLASWRSASSECPLLARSRHLYPSTFTCTSQLHLTRLSKRFHQHHNNTAKCMEKNRSKRKCFRSTARTKPRLLPVQSTSRAQVHKQNRQHATYLLGLANKLTWSHLYWQLLELHVQKLSRNYRECFPRQRNRYLHQ